MVFFELLFCSAIRVASCEDAAIKIQQNPSHDEAKDHMLLVQGVIIFWMPNQFRQLRQALDVHIMLRLCHSNWKMNPFAIRRKIIPATQSMLYTFGQKSVVAQISSCPTPSYMVLSIGLYVFGIFPSQLLKEGSKLA